VQGGNYSAACGTIVVAKKQKRKSAYTFRYDVKCTFWPEL
jgi:hypothetical protein